MVERVRGMDTEACPVITTVEDTSGVSSSICPTADVIACMDNGSSRAISAYDIAASPSHAMSAMGAPDTPSSIHPAANTTTYASDSFGHAVFPCDVAATLGHVTSATGAPAMPSTVCSPMDAIVGCGSAISTMAPLLTSSVVPANSWRTGRRVRLFYGTSLREVPCPVTLRKT